MRAARPCAELARFPSIPLLAVSATKPASMVRGAAAPLASRLAAGASAAVPTSPASALVHSRARAVRPPPFAETNAARLTRICASLAQSAATRLICAVLNAVIRPKHPAAVGLI